MPRTGPGGEWLSSDPYLVATTPVDILPRRLPQAWPCFPRSWRLSDPEGSWSAPCSSAGPTVAGDPSQRPLSPGPACPPLDSPCLTGSLLPSSMLVLVMCRPASCPGLPGTPAPVGSAVLALRHVTGVATSWNLSHRGQARRLSRGLPAPWGQAWPEQREGRSRGQGGETQQRPQRPQ